MGQLPSPATLADNFFLEAMSPAFRDDPYPLYERFRRREPLLRIADTIWFSLAHADVMALLRHPRLSSDESHATTEMDEAEQSAKRVDVDILALDDALKTLSAMDPQQGKVVELKFFGGLSIEDTAEVLGISSSTVKRDWFTARAWLHRELDRTGAI